MLNRVQTLSRWLLISMLLLSTLPFTSSADSELDKIDNELQGIATQKSEAQHNAEKAQERIGEIEAEKSVVVQDIFSLTDQIDDAAALLLELEESIFNQERELDQAEQDLEAAIERIEDRDQLLQSRLRFMYTNGAVSYLDVLLQSSSFGDFLERFNTLKSLVGQDKQILESNRKDRQFIEEQKIGIEQMIVQLDSDRAEAEIMRQTLLEQRRNKEVMIASLNAEEQQMEQITEEQERILIEAARAEEELRKKRLTREEQIQREAEERERAAERARRVQLQNESPTYEGSGILGYPLPRKYVTTSGFGSRVDPITGRPGAYHSGLDYGAPGGTSVLAAEDGHVLTAEFYGGYGYAVVIDHGGGLWTLYAHMQKGSLAVSKGDKVKKGDKVGQVGTTGRSTGNHLHFEVRVDGKAVNPSGYVN